MASLKKSNEGSIEHMNATTHSPIVSVGLNMGAMGGLNKGGNLEGETRKKGSIEGWSIQEILDNEKK